MDVDVAVDVCDGWMDVMFRAEVDGKEKGLERGFPGLLCFSWQTESEVNVVCRDVLLEISSMLMVNVCKRG